MTADQLCTPRSGLFYHGSDREVMLGDRVKIKRLLRRGLDGVVCYIPGMSPRHPEMEYEDVKQWAIRASNGAVYPIAYDPRNFQPPKHIVFVGRGTSHALEPEDVLE